MLRCVGQIYTTINNYIKEVGNLFEDINVYYNIEQAECPQKIKMNKYFSLILFAVVSLVVSLAFFPNESRASFSFAVVGDSRGSTGGPNAIFTGALKQMAKKTDGPIFSLGDLINGCDGTSKCVSKFKAWRGMWGGLISRDYPIVGNHDRSNAQADSVWQRLFPLPNNGPAGYKKLVYSFDYKDGHFVILDSEKPAEHVINKIQRDWLDKDLSNSDKKYNFVLYHEPAFSVSRDNDGLEVKTSERDAFWDIIDKYDVTAVFNGHEHLYARKKIDSSVYSSEKHTIFQFTVGNTDVDKADRAKPGVPQYSYRGKSFAVVTVGDDGKISVELYTVYGQIVNRFTFSK